MHPVRQDRIDPNVEVGTREPRDAAVGEDRAVDSGALLRIQIHIRVDVRVHVRVRVDVRVHIPVRAAITAVELPLVRRLPCGAGTTARPAVHVLADPATLVFTGVGAVAARAAVDLGAGADVAARALARVAALAAVHAATLPFTHGSARPGAFARPGGSSAVLRRGAARYRATFGRATA